jgi:rhodanese-related sulfurtransferase
VNYGPIPTVAVADLPDPLPEGLTVLDVREKIEWVHGHIDGATHIPLHELPARIGEIPHQQTLVVCKVGGRSAQAVAYLSANGHDAVNLAGGMLDWFAAGRPMVSDTGTDPHVV